MRRRHVALAVTGIAGAIALLVLFGRPAPPVSAVATVTAAGTPSAVGDTTAAATPPARRDTTAAGVTATSAEPSPSGARLARATAAATCGRMLTFATARLSPFRRPPGQETPVADAQEKLLRSADPEHRYAAAILESDETRRRQLLLEVLEPDTTNAVLAWHAWLLCSNDDSDCPLETLERRLLTLDSSNGDAWASVAASRYRRGETDRALANLRRAGAASQASVHFVDTIELLERALAANTDVGPAERQHWAFGSAVVHGDYFDVLEMCRERVGSDDWARACLAYGELMERVHDTAMGRGVGTAIQRDALDALNDTRGLEALAARRALAQARAATLNDAFAGTLVSAAASSSPARLQSYLNHWRQQGEVEGTLAFAASELPAVLDSIGVDRAAIHECLPLR